MNDYRTGGDTQLDLFFFPFLTSSMFELISQASSAFMNYQRPRKTETYEYIRKRTGRGDAVFPRLTSTYSSKTRNRCVFVMHHLDYKL